MDCPLSLGCALNPETEQFACRNCSPQNYQAECIMAATGDITRNCSEAGFVVDTSCTRVRPSCEIRDNVANCVQRIAPEEREEGM